MVSYHILNYFFLTNKDFKGTIDSKSTGVALMFYSDQAGERSNISLLTFKTQGKIIFYAGVTISFGRTVLLQFIFSNQNT